MSAALGAVPRVARELESFFARALEPELFERVLPPLDFARVFGVDLFGAELFARGLFEPGDLDRPPGLFRSAIPAANHTAANEAWRHFPGAPRQ